MLSPILPEIYAGFENAVFEARDYFAAKSISLDRSALSMLIRLHVKDRLQKMGMTDVVLENPALCGLSFRHQDVCVRIWKSEDHQLPDPGASKTRQAYYQYSLPFDDGKNYRKFVILWNLDGGFHFTLWLVCPKNFDSETRESEVHWYAPIPDLALAITSETKVSRPSDLPIRRRESKKKTENR